MKSAVYQAYGHPEVVAIAEQSVPTSGPRDLLIRVQALALTVNVRDAPSFLMPFGCR